LRSAVQTARDAGSGFHTSTPALGPFSTTLYVFLPFLWPKALKEGMEGQRMKSDETMVANSGLWHYSHRCIFKRRIPIHTRIELLFQEMDADRDGEDSSRSEERANEVQETPLLEQCHRVLLIQLFHVELE